MGRLTMRRSWPLAALALLGLAACAHAVGPAPAPPARLPAVEPSQSLLRVDYHGPDGQGRLRLILRRRGVEDFGLDANDVLGRALWTLRVAGGELTLVDHRRRVYCRAATEISIPERGLADLPVRALARVLLGELPVERPALAAGPEFDFEDARGQRWSGALDGKGPVRWTLWSAGEPMVWWQRTERGGILSHRAGGQFRWRLAVSEPLATGGEEAGERVAPEGYEPGSCAPDAPLPG